MDTPHWNQRPAAAENPSRWERGRARLFAARVTVGVMVLLLFGWPLWLLCLLADAWATRDNEEGEEES